ncbi:MAG: sigma factor [Hymenobacter sp.]
MLGRLYARDETAMAHFYKNYKRALYYTIWRIVRQDEIAEDLLQECMLKFWVAFPTYATAQGPTLYLGPANRPQPGPRQPAGAAPQSAVYLALY